jgi:hypothetical protein
MLTEGGEYPSDDGVALPQALRQSNNPTRNSGAMRPLIIPSFDFSMEFAPHRISLASYAPVQFQNQIFFSLCRGFAPVKVTRASTVMLTAGGCSIVDEFWVRATGIYDPPLESGNLVACHGD